MALNKNLNKNHYSLAEMLFPPGYVFNGLFGSGNSSTNYTFNGYRTASSFTLFEVLNEI